jgi:porin
MSIKLFACLLSCLVFIAPVHAEDEGPDYSQDTLTGDWGGLRTDWAARGLNVDLGFKSDFLRNVKGGTKRGGRPVNQFDLKIQGDLERLAGLPGASVYFNLIYDGGGKTNRDHVGSLMGVSNTEVPVSTFRVFHAWFEQTFDDKQWALLLGLYPIDSEFQVLESAGLFVLPPYGPTADLSLTRGPSIFNQSAFGVRGKWQSSDQKAYAMVAVLDGIPGDPDHPKGTHIQFNDGDGTMQIAELGFTPRAAGPSSDQGETEASAPPGLEKYALGFWRYTARVDDLVDLDTAGNPVQRKSNGWYVQAEKTLFNWNDGDLAAFVRYSRTDGDSTAIRDVSTLGTRIRGIIPGRDQDYFGVAYTRSSIGDKWRTAQAATGISTAGSESAVEITYRAQATRWLAIQPVYQYIKSPGAVTDVPNATLIGVKFDLAI